MRVKKSILQAEGSMPGSSGAAEAHMLRQGMFFPCRDKLTGHLNS